MSTPVVIGGTTYRIPAYTDTGWAQGTGNLSSFLVVVGGIAESQRLVGTNTSAAVAQSSAVSSPGTGLYFDITSFSLGAGRWSVSCAIGFSHDAFTITTVFGGVGTSAGNSSTGLILGNTWFPQLPPVSGVDSSLSIPSMIFELAVTTTIYLKALMNFSAGSSAAYGRITAVQIG